jgi:hypothetical protein
MDNDKQERMVPYANLSETMSNGMSLIRLLLTSLSLNLCTHIPINTLDSMHNDLHIPDLGNQRNRPIMSSAF